MNPMCPCGAEYNFTCVCSPLDIAKHQLAQNREQISQALGLLRSLKAEAKRCLVSTAGKHALRTFEVSADQIIAVCAALEPK